MKRRNTTTACQPCRKRRAKCDGKKPKCSRCHERVLQCNYAIEADGRRPASKTHVQLLRSRIELLELTLKAHSIDVDMSLETPDSVLHAEQLQSLGHNTVTPVISGRLSRDSSMNFDQDGEARYFGLASGRLEFKPSTRAPCPSDPSSRLLLNSFYQDIIQEKIISVELEDELIHTYFAWEQPWVQAVDEKLFREARATGGKYFSPLLLNCILAIASRYSVSTEVRSDPSDPNTAGQLFLEKAEILLHYEMKSPSITTLQSLCIFGNMYVAYGSDAAGWLHHGMANRLALDMGLNLDPPSVNPSGWLSSEEAELRKRIYWSLYCIDKTASMYTGRVCTMLDSQAHVSLPEPMDLSKDADPYEVRRAALGKILRAYISICKIIEKILLALYAPKPNLRSHRLPFFLSDMVLGLKNWSYDLPKELGLEHNGVPQREPAVYITHMIYHTAFILLMKPTLVRAQDAESRKISHQAATDVCNVAQKYRNAFGSFRQSPVTATYCMLSATLTMINAGHHHWEGLSLATNNRNIELGLSVLGELSISWNPAKRIRQNLQNLYYPTGNLTDTGISSIENQGNLDVSRDGNYRETGESEWQINGPSATSSGGKEVVHTQTAENPSSLMESHDDQHQPLDTLGNWPFNQIFVDESPIPDAEFFDALHNFSYMETNPIFQFDSFPEDYSSFDILNRIQVHNM